MKNGNPYFVSQTGSFRVETSATTPPENAPSKKACRKLLEELLEELRDLQRRLYADDRYAVLLIFQAMDAAGKDGTIRAVMSGVNPAGCQVFSFKKPSDEELDHDFLWRTAKSLPERGRIGIFNRSYYEEVLVVRVHPEFLEGQKLPTTEELDVLWEQRYESIRTHEKHLAESGTIILKFWLNVSKKEQRERFLARIDEPEKNWKFSDRDVYERQFWDDYMRAYQDALIATSCPWAPWYAIPADSKSYMRYQVAQILVDRLNALGLSYPQVSRDDRKELMEMREVLENER